MRVCVCVNVCVNMCVCESVCVWGMLLYVGGDSVSMCGCDVLIRKALYCSQCLSGTDSVNKGVTYSSD